MVRRKFCCLIYTIECTLLFTFVVTSGCTEGGVRLAGGETVMEGRVEVCHNQIWWAVSGSYWDFRDATVVCRHLHYPANCEWCNNEQVYSNF